MIQFISLPLITFVSRITGREKWMRIHRKRERCSSQNYFVLIFCCPFPVIRFIFLLSWLRILLGRKLQSHYYLTWLVSLSLPPFISSDVSWKHKKEGCVYSFTRKRIQEESKQRDCIFLFFISLFLVVEITSFLISSHHFFFFSGREIEFYSCLLA